MEDYLNQENCPHCESPWNGYSCEVCGFSDDLPVGEYETPEGNIVICSEKQAFDNGLLYICPVCCYNVITWWEMEDHKCCIECWHKNKMLTKKR